jgi:pimeloyl-ACP methyl ester carboxylesterase
MVGVLFPVLSHVLFLLRNFWPSKERIASIDHPILFIRSLRDEIVPTGQMQKLIASALKCKLKD